MQRLRAAQVTLLLRQAGSSFGSGGVFGGGDAAAATAVAAATTSIGASRGLSSFLSTPGCSSCGERGCCGSLFSCSSSTNALTTTGWAQHQQSRSFAAAKKQQKQPAKGGKGGKQQGKKGAPGSGKSKVRIERAALDEKDPFMARVIGMVIAGPPAHASASSASASAAAEGKKAGKGGAAADKAAAAAAEAEAEEAAAAAQEAAAERAKRYSGLKMAEHKAWRRDLSEKLALKRAALRALPPDLRRAASVEDLAPFPLTRNFLFDTPPESYRS